MKRKKLTKILFISLGVIAFGMMTSESNATEVFVEKAAVHYGHQRPFSFYYPYNYKYYTPHRKYAPSYGYTACRWRYTNGNYIYLCK